MLKSEIPSKSLRILHKVVSLRKYTNNTHISPHANKTRIFPILSHNIAHVRCVMTTGWHINQYNCGTIYLGQHQIPWAKNSIPKTASISNTNYSFQVVTMASEPLTINSMSWYHTWAVSFVWKVTVFKNTLINAYCFIIKDAAQEQATCRGAHDRIGWASMLSLGTPPSRHCLSSRTQKLVKSHLFPVL